VAPVDRAWPWRAFALRNWLFLLLLPAVPIVEYLAAAGGGPRPSLALVRNPFAAIAAASVFIRYFIDDFRGPARRWVVYLTPLTWIGALAVEGGGALPTVLWLDTLFALGLLGAFGYVLAASMATEPAATARYADQLMDALLLPLAASMTSYGLWSTYGLNPVYDPRVYAFEQILGVPFSLLGAWSYRLLSPLSGIASTCYNLVAVGIALVAAGQSDERRQRGVLSATLVGGACGFALYFVCPVVGPVVSFGPFYPDTLPTVPLMPALLMARDLEPRNGMPSLHTVWALLIWFNVQAMPARLRWALRAFVVLTLWAVMSPEGSHWFMDLVVSVPLTVAIQSAFLSRGFEPARRTWSTVVVCSAVTFVWLFGFRSGGPLLAFPPILAWLAVAGTVWWPLSRLRSFVEPALEQRAVVPVRSWGHSPLR
jgi:hypothetical protein